MNTKNLKSKSKINDTFELTFTENWFCENDVIIDGLPYYTYKAKIINKPKRKWYKVLLQYLTLGLYKAPYEYQIKII